MIFFHSGRFLLYFLSSRFVSLLSPSLLPLSNVSFCLQVSSTQPTAHFPVLGDQVIENAWFLLSWLDLCLYKVQTVYHLFFFPMLALFVCFQRFFSVLPVPNYSSPFRVFHILHAFSAYVGVDFRIVLCILSSAACLDPSLFF